MNTERLAVVLNVSERTIQRYKSGAVVVPAHRVVAYCLNTDKELKDVRADLHGTGLIIDPDIRRRYKVGASAV